jgi:anti-sigma-K factor RskA
MVHRRPMDRVVSVFYKVHRYECHNDPCGWEGTVRSTSQRAAKKAKGMKPWMWLLVVAISIAAALAMVIYIDTRPTAEPAVESTPAP